MCMAQLQEGIFEGFDKNKSLIATIVEPEQFIEYILTLSSLSVALQSLVELKHDEYYDTFMFIVKGMISMEAITNTHISIEHDNYAGDIANILIDYRFKQHAFTEIELFKSEWVNDQELENSYGMLMEAYSSHRVGFLKLSLCENSSNAIRLNDQLIKITKEFDMLFDSFNKILNAFKSTLKK